MVSDGTVLIYTDGIANTTALESESIISGLSDGTHTFSIVAIDEAGNIGLTTVAFTIDTSSTTPETSVFYSTSVIYETSWVTQTKSTAEFATLALFAGIFGVFMLRRRKRN